MALLLYIYYIFYILYICSGIWLAYIVSGKFYTVVFAIQIGFNLDLVQKLKEMLKSKGVNVNEDQNKRMLSGKLV